MRLFRLFPSTVPYFLLQQASVSAKQMINELQSTCQQLDKVRTVQWMEVYLDMHVYWYSLVPRRAPRCDHVTEERYGMIWIWRKEIWDDMMIWIWRKEIWDDMDTEERYGNDAVPLTPDLLE